MLFRYQANLYQPLSDDPALVVVCEWNCTKLMFAC